MLIISRVNDGDRALRTGYEGAYQLAVRDLPDIVALHVSGPGAREFACGARRSIRFPKSLGFDVIGVDISERMRTLTIRPPGSESRRSRRG